MKKLNFIYLFAGLSLAVILFQSNAGGYSDGNATGSPGGTAGCSCHTLIAQPQGNLFIFVSDSVGTSVNSYKPGAKYTISISLSSNKNQFTAGFQATVFNAVNNFVGTFENNIMPSQVSVLPLVNNPAITVARHNTAVVGSISSGNTTTWKFSWKAPNIGVGNVEFYAGAIDANFNTQNTGDDYHKTSRTLPEMVSGINDIFKTSIKSIYPNPASQYIKLDIPSMQGKAKIEVYSISGQKMMTMNDDANQIQVPVVNLSNGAYMVYVSQNGKTAIGQFIKQ